MHRTVLVCQHSTCHQQGSGKVLTAFQLYAPSEIAVETSGCLGQCGSGPMVVILPEETWYCHLDPDDVPVIVSQHLKGGEVVTERLYPKFHPSRQPIWIWLIAFCILLGSLILVYWILTNSSHY